MAKITRGFQSETDRYQYDFDACHFKNGWAQLDTKQDASYYGNWINPFKKQLFSYAEGDTTRTECESDEDFIAAVRATCEWQKEFGSFIGIDPMGDEAMEAEFDRLGLSEYLHGRIRKDSL